MSNERSGIVSEGPLPVVAIVGLGGIGTALGLALQAVKTRYTIWGHDREPSRTKEAQRLGAIDRGHWNLVAVAEAADLLFVTEPLSETLNTLALVGPHMRPGSVVSDTATLKSPVLRCAEEHLAAGVSYVGGHPILGAETSDGPEALRGAVYCLVPARSADERAVGVIADLVRAVGARPYYIDAEEHDALVAGVDHVPGLVAACLLDNLARSTSARDLRRLIGPALEPALAEEAAWLADAGAALRANGAATLDWLDRLLSSLQSWREDLAAENWESLDARVEACTSSATSWPSGDDDAVRSAAMDELKEHSPVRQALFGRLLLRRPGSKHEP